MSRKRFRPALTTAFVLMLMGTAVVLSCAGPATTGADVASIAQSRGLSDADVVAAMLQVADSRFQDELMRQAKDAGKLPRSHEISAAHRENYPERISAALKPARDAGLLPSFPFGSDFTDVEQRVQVPWRPRDIADNFIVFRRRIGNTEEYIDDLRVRRNFIRRILDLLMEPGFYRPDQGEQCRHMYYASCDRLESNIEDLPEDAVPDDLNFQPLDEDLPSGHLGKQMFVDWMQFGRQDCDVATALGYSWTENLRGSGGESLGEFYDRLLIEREENEHG